MASKRFFHRLTSALSHHRTDREVSLREPYRLGRDRVRIPCDSLPLSVKLVRAGSEFHIHQEILQDNTTESRSPSVLLFDPNHCYSSIGGFLRLSEGETLVIGHHDKLQAVMFDYSANMGIRHLSICHDGDALVFKELLTDCEILLSPLPAEFSSQRLLDRRMENLRKIRDIFRGPLEPLAPKDALATLQAVNRILEEEAYRPLDDRSKPGGVIKIPSALTPIIVGDLHAQVNNLLTLLSQNGFLEALEAGTATLIILGDAVHSEVDGQLDEMESSVLMMDLILQLKIRFPQQVFYIRGNHDGFSDSVFKAGVAQCLNWETALRNRRGESYLEQMNLFYEQLPYLVLNKDYVACHAAPVKTRFDVDMLVNIHRHPGLVQELTRNRLRRRDYPAGYAKGDVKHFRDTLNLPEDTPFFVSHSPLNRQDAMWLEAGGIRNHHIVFSANIPWIGVFTRVNDRLIPLHYLQENLLSVINGLT